jgi:hypothetical protein
MVINVHGATQKLAGGRRIKRGRIKKREGSALQIDWSVNQLLETKSLPHYALNPPDPSCYRLARAR